MLAEHPQLSEQPLVECCAWIDEEHQELLAVALELGELVAQLRPGYGFGDCGFGVSIGTDRAS
jgi:hypothetical protein